MKKTGVWLSAMVMASALAGCGEDAAPAPNVESPVRQQVVEDAKEPDAKALAVGEAVIAPRLGARQESMGAIAFDATHRLGVHPGRSASSWVDINVGGLRTLELFPVIRKLSPACAANPQAGIVALKLQLDGAPVGLPLDIDRYWQKKVALDVSGAGSLRVEVGNGNGSAACDWFALGFGKAE